MFFMIMLEFHLAGSREIGEPEERDGTQVGEGVERKPEELADHQGPVIETCYRLLVPCESNCVWTRIEELKATGKRMEENTRRSMEENMELQSKCRTLEEDLRLER